MASRFLKLRRIALFLLLCALCTQPFLRSDLHAGPRAIQNLSEPFDQATEFPNFFIPEKYRGMPTDQVPAEVISQSHQLLEKALGSVFDRMVMPLVHPGEPTPRLTRYFPHLQKALAAVDPNVKLYASGGVVRSAITYLYDQVYRELQKNPAQSSHDFLKAFSESKSDIPAGDVRGVGSDFDLLIDSPAGKGSELQKLAGQLTNSAAQSVGTSVKNASMKNSLFTMGDIRDYDTQITRSTRQGGSTIDYLAFDVARQSLKNPPRFPDISRDLVLGLYEFAGPERAEFLEDQADTVIRGYRTLLETPWLKLKDNKVFKEGIDQLKKNLAQGQTISSRAKGQFAKGLRNSRYFGAHNRFHRTAPGSIEAELLEYTDALSKKDKTIYLPEFADALPIEKRDGKRSELNGLPVEILERPKDFLKSNTRDGKVFHGTPSIENALAILRQGLFLSKSDQGTAAYGRGVYTSPHLSTSRGYAGSGGLIFELSIKDDPRVNILDWKKHSTHPSIVKIANKAKEQGRDVFEYLSREHGIDIIKNEHILIQNSEALRLPKGLNAVLNPLANRFRGIESFTTSDLDAYSELKQLLDYAQLLGESSLLEPEEEVRLNRLFVSAGLGDPRAKVREVAAGLIGILPPNEFTPALKKLVTDADSSVRAAAFSSDWSGLTAPEKGALILSGIGDSSPIEAAAIRQFLLLSPEQRESVATKLKQHMPKDKIPVSFLDAYYVNGPGSKTDLSAWIHHGLSSGQWTVRQSTARLIRGLSASQQSELVTKILKDPDTDVQLAGVRAIDWTTLPDQDRLQAFQLMLEPSRKSEVNQFPNKYYSENSTSENELSLWIQTNLDHKDWRMRQSAARLIKKLPASRQAEFVTKILKDPDTDVQFAGVRAIDWTTLPDQDRLQAFQLMLEPSRKSEVNQFPNKYYSENSTSENELSLWIQTNLDHKDWRMRQSFARLIKKLPASRQAEFVTKILNDPDGDVQWAGLNAMDWNGISIADHVPIVQKALRSRKTKITRLGESLFHRLTPDLQLAVVATLQDSWHEIHHIHKLTVTLIESGPPPGTNLSKWIELALNYPNSTIRNSALERIATLPIEKQIPLLIKASANNAPEVRVTALRALPFEQLDEETQVSIISTAYRDSATRLNAAVQFNRLSSATKEQILKKILNDLETVKEAHFPKEVFLPDLWDKTATREKPAVMDWGSSTQSALLKKALMSHAPSIADPAMDYLIESAQKDNEDAIRLVREVSDDTRVHGSSRKRMIAALPSLKLKYSNVCVLKIRNALHWLSKK